MGHKRLTFIVASPPIKVKLYPYLVTFHIKTPNCEWYVVRCVSKNGYQKHMCLKEIIGLSAQNMITILGASIVKWTKQVLRYTKAVVFLVKRL